MLFLLLSVFFGITVKAQEIVTSSVDYSPSGTKLALSTDVTVQIFDTSSGQILNTFPIFSERILAVKWDPSETKLAVATGNHVQIWNVSTNQSVLMFQDHSRPVKSVAWSPDGSKIASASSERTQIWNSTTGQLLLTLSGHIQPLTEVIWSPDGSKVATSGLDAAIVVWDAATGDSIEAYRIQDSLDPEIDRPPIYSISWKSDGSQIAAVSLDGSVRILDAATLQPLGLLKGHLDSPISVAWSPNGQYLASGSVDNTIRIWDAATGQTVEVIPVDTSVASLSWSPDSSKLAYADASGTLQLIPIMSSAPTLTPTPSATPTSTSTPTPTPTLTATPTATHTSTATPTNTPSPTPYPCPCTLFGTSVPANAQQNPPPPAATSPRSIAWNPDGVWIARAFQNGTVDVVNANTGATVFSYNNGQSPATAVTWRPGAGSTKLAAAVGNSIYFWDIPNTSILYTLPGPGGNIDSLDWTTQNGDKLASASFEATSPNLRIWDMSNRQLIFSVGVGQLSTASWNAIGTKLVIGDGLGIKTFDLSTGQVQMLSANSVELSAVRSVAWSPDGTKIADSGVFGQVTFRNASNGQFIAYSEPTRDLVNWIAWSNDSTRLASASWDGTVRVWNAANGVLIDTIQPGNGRVFSVDWSPDNSKLVVGSENGAVQIFPAMNICPRTLFGVVPELG